MGISGRLLAGVIALSGLALVFAPKGLASGPQELADRSETWLERVMRVDVPRRELIRSPGLWLATGSDAEVDGERILVDGATWRDLASLTDERPVQATHAVHLLLHELLHRGTPPGPEAIPWAEEGIVDALAWDLAPAWMARFTGWVPPADPPDTYRAEVFLIRRASMLATGEPWRSRDARMWRRSLWAADDAVRAQMLTGAFALLR